MKKVLFFVFVSIGLASCHHLTGSGRIITEKRSTLNFTGISSGGGIDVEVKIGPVFEVTVESDDNIIKYIETEVKDDILKIRLKSNRSYNNAHLKVYVTAPLITNIKAAASSEVVVKDVMVHTGKLTFTASSSAGIKAVVEAPEVETSASSSATIEISGKTRVYTASANSSADLKTINLLSEDTRVTVSSSASASVHASVNLNARASSSGDITYRGAANVQKTISSSGSIEKKE